MFRLVTLVLLALLAACSSVTRTEPQSSSTAANQPPPDCARYEPDTPEKQKCLEQAQPVSIGMATAILAGGMASILVGTAVMALSDEHAKAEHRPHRHARQWISALSRERAAIHRRHRTRGAAPDAVARRADGYLHVDYGLAYFR